MKQKRKRYTEDMICPYCGKYQPDVYAISSGTSPCFGCGRTFRWKRLSEDCYITEVIHEETEA